MSLCVLRHTRVTKSRKKKPRKKKKKVKTEPHQQHYCFLLRQGSHRGGSNHCTHAAAAATATSTSRAVSQTRSDSEPESQAAVGVQEQEPLSLACTSYDSSQHYTLHYNHVCEQLPEQSSSCVASFLGRFSFQPTKENPLLGPSSSTLEKMGALDVDKVVHHHQGWRLITCIWLHAGVVHILDNMLCLLFIGIRLEQELCFFKIGLVYIISGLGGSVLLALFIQNNISVGASGALFGLLGAMLSELLTNWTIYANKCAALTTLIFVIVLNLAIGILPHVDNFAHLGGFITGFLLGFVVLIRPQFGWVS